jgi:ElaB/YqjD/DUF883 family membrane-anchored ribosome-binding protein
MNQRNVEGNGSRAAEAAAGGLGKMKDQLSGAADAASGKFDNARQSAADKLHGAADTVRQGADAVASATHSAADRLASSADYLESHDARRMLSDLIEVVKKYPGRSIVIATVIGFMISRAFRGSGRRPTD